MSNLKIIYNSKNSNESHLIILYLKLTKNLKLAKKRNTLQDASKCKTTCIVIKDKNGHLNIY